MSISPNKENNNKKIGPIISTTIIVLVLTGAALYVFASKLNERARVVEQNSLETVDSSTPVKSQPSTTKTDIKALQNDLNNATKGLEGQ